MFAAMSMTLLLATRITALLPVHPGRMYLRIGYAPCAQSVRISFQLNKNVLRNGVLSISQYFFVDMWNGFMHLFVL